MKFKVFILLFFLSFFIQSQKKESINIDRAIGVSCFFSGEPTAIINYFYDLIDTSDFNKIKRELFSNKPENKLVSLIILEELEKLKIITLNIEQKEQINKIKKSNEMVLYCSGCLYLNSVSIKDFLKSYNYQIIISLRNRLENR